MVDFIGNVSIVCAVCEELQDRSTGHNKEDIHSLASCAQWRNANKRYC
jgi:hypothetical protein